MTSKDELVRGLIGDYERAFNRCLDREAEIDEVSVLFTDPVVNAWFAGVEAASREEFEEGMIQNLDGYRSRGLQAKHATEIRVTSIDAVHAVADVTWTFHYRRSDGTETPYQSNIAYLVQVRDGVARIFGWLIGRDSRPDLRRLGVIHQG